MAGLQPGEGFMEIPDTAVATTSVDEAARPPAAVEDGAKTGAGRTAVSAKPEIVQPRQKELGHA
jgi:hypothetical protein